MRDSGNRYVNELLLPRVDARGLIAFSAASGPSMAGKKVVCQRAAGIAEYVPYLHVSDASAGTLQLARTVSTWFAFSDSPEVVKAANDVSGLMSKKRWCRAHDACVRLIDLAVAKGLRACFLVDRVQFLDDFSMSLLRESLHRIPGARANNSHQRSILNRKEGPQLHLSGSDSSSSGGKICFLCVHVPHYNWRSAEHILEDITRTHKTLEIPVIPVGEATTEELSSLLSDVTTLGIDELWQSVSAEAAGNCTGYFMERNAAFKNLSAELWKEGKPGYLVVSNELKLQSPTGYFRKDKGVKVMQVSADVAIRFTQLYDNLPPLLQMYCRILAVSIRPCLVSVPQSIMWEVMNDIVAKGVEQEQMEVLVEEMKAMYLIKYRTENAEEVISFQCPALRDIALDVCTPVQLESIRRALIDRFRPRVLLDFRVPFVIADLQLSLGEDPQLQLSLWRQGFTLYQRQSRDWTDEARDRWQILLEAEVEGAGCDAQEVFGVDFWCPIYSKRSIDPQLLHLHVYVGPISYGPMADTLTLICRKLFQSITLLSADEKPTSNRQVLSMANTCERYLNEMSFVESYLSCYGIQERDHQLQTERSLILSITSIPETERDLVQNAASFLNEYIPNFVQPRVERLRRLVDILRQRGTPPAIEDAEPALRKAYRVLASAPERRNDAAQKALMVLATHNWKPRPPEELPHVFHQTVAFLRNRVLKRLTDAEAFMFKHRQNEDDLEAFLVITPLLLAAEH